MIDSRRVVEPAGEEMEKREFPEADAIGIVTPVNEGPAVNHDAEDGEVNPVKPPGCQRVFFFEDLHDC